MNPRTARPSLSHLRVAHGVPLRDDAVVGVAEAVPRQDQRLPRDHSLVTSAPEKYTAYHLFGGR